MTLNFPADTTNPFVDPSTGLKYLFNSSIGAWETALQPPVVISATDPGLDIPGFLWWDSEGGSLYVRYDDGNTEQWVEAVPTGGSTGAIAHVSPFPPTGPLIGQLWVDITDPVNAQLKVWASVGGPASWLNLTSPSFPFSGAYDGPRIQALPFAPSDPGNNDVWFHPSQRKLRIYTSGEWQEITSQDTVAPATVSKVKVNDPLYKIEDDIFIRDADAQQKGVIRIATQGEVNEGKSSSTAVTPSKLKNAVIKFLPHSSYDNQGIVRLCRVNESDLTIDKAVTPLFVKNRIDKAVPVGTVIMHPSSSLVGYRQCDGSSLLTSSFPELAAALNVTTDSFVVPNLNTSSSSVKYHIKTNK